QAHARAAAFDIRNGRTRQPLEQPRGRRPDAERAVDAQQHATDAVLRVEYWPQLRHVDQFLRVYPRRSGMHPEELGMRLLHFSDLAVDPEQTHVLAHALGMEGETDHDDL